MTSPETSSGAESGVSISDAELIAHFRAHRSPEGLTRIIARHGPMVFRTCLRILGDAAEAEDAAQATFIVLQRRPEAAASAKSPALWLFGIARQTASNAARARARRIKREHIVAEREAKKMAHPTSHAEVRDLKEELDAALDRLPATLREAVILRYLEGLQEKEAARAAGCPAGTMAWRAAEGLSRLRDIFARRGVVVGAGVLLAFLAREATAAVPAAALSAPGASASLLAEGILKTLTWAKIKLWTLGVAAAATMATVPALWVHHDVAPSPPPAFSLCSAFRMDAQGSTRMALSPDGKTLAAGTGDGAIRRLDLTSGREQSPLQVHSRAVQSLAFSPDGKRFAVGSDDATVRIWDLDKGEERVAFRVIPIREVVVSSVAFSPDGTHLATGHQEGEEAPLTLWNLERGEKRTSLVGHTDIIHCVAFSPRGDTLASAGRDRTVKLWDVATGRERASLSMDMAQIVALAFSPNGRHLAIGGGWGGAGGTLVLWNLSSGETRTLVQEKNLQVSVHHAAFSPDGKILAAAMDDGSVGLWRAETGESIAVLHEEAPAFFAAFADDRTLVTAGSRGAVNLYRIR